MLHKTSNIDYKQKNAKHRKQDDEETVR